MKTYYGTYTEYGYKIRETEEDNPVYEAGNHRLESTTIVSPHNEYALSLKAIRNFCESTGKEIAKENSGQWNGIQSE